MAMIRQFFSMAALSVALGNSCLAADKPLTFPDLFGTWKIDRMVGIMDITGSDDSSRKGIGTSITISADRISNTYTPTVFCRPRNPTITEVDTEAKLENDYGIKGSSFYLPAGALKPRLPYLDVDCEDAFILDRNTLLWTLGNGFIYTARREHRR